MATISDLTVDLVGEILSRVPLTSLSAVRSTCKNWNALSKNLILGGKKAARNHHQFLELMFIDSRVCSLRIDLQGIPNEDKDDNLVDPSLMKQISIPNNSNIVFEISQVYHCDGLLLCITKANSKLFVWNPYLGQTKWIRPRNQFHRHDRFAIGYDINRNHKIVRFFYDNYEKFKGNLIDVYDFSSDSWRVLDVNPNWDIPFHRTDVSLKGNTYFFYQKFTTDEYLEEIDSEDYFLCFDFTTERFGTRLPLPLSLPFNSSSPSFHTVTLSWVRDEKLAALYKHYDTHEIIEIWISTKIEPNAVSWSTFLRLDTTLIIGLPDQFYPYFQANSFFVDEEKKIAVFFGVDRLEESETFGCETACIFGEDGYFKSINIEVVANLERRSGKLMCSSYLPSLVQLQV